ncbi:neuronal PAS domain-containing protein 1 isoform X1 [Salmo trutta]|uniref:neuronal PAS domain-containing protein 1 isoform X1 n=1 Tax=Salmo trutta TaxID=8032 RepID=UPI001130BB03|nr:neuronal PAS domain-containing protein 1-like isoform X1 [Salmo trutta]XP_029570413.1 neuronal PAS domain-containing protein 1-like isoform X1 [Salmo trutta]
MATMPFVSEGKCVSVEWDFLQGLLAKPPTLPCLQNLRKEKSRNAARSRRGKENFEFFELAKMLPLPGAITSQLDKASVIRLTISYLHMCTFASQGDPPWCPLLEGENHCSKVRRSSHSLATDMFEQHLGAHLLQSLDGFVFVVSSEGRFLYISETVSIYLGLSQVELMGSSVFDYIHPADHVEMAERLGIRPHLRAEAGCHVAPESASSSASTSSLAGTPEPAPSSPLSPGNEPPDRGFFIRMKSTLTKRGLHVKSSGYKVRVIHVTGRIRCRPAMVPGSARSVRRPMGLVALAHTLPPSTLNEVRMESQMFVFRVNMDLQVTYCENRISEYMDLSPAEVVGNTCYHFIHVEDLDNIRQSHEDLLRKGQVVTGYYRWLQRRGGYLWVQSCATVSINHKAPHERNVIWVNYVISRTELPDTPLDLLQLPESLRAERLKASSSPSELSPQARGPQPMKSSVCKGDPDSKLREIYNPGVQSGDRRKRPLRSDSEGALPETRRRLEEFRQREGSVSASSDLGSESEGEERAWEQGGDSARVKREEGPSKRGGETPVRGERGGRVHNGRAVIQHLKSVVSSPLSGPHNIKTEHEALAAGGRWTHTHTSSHTQPPPSHTPCGSLNGDSPPTPIPDSSSSSEAPPKGIFTPPSPAMSPPMSGSSPLPFEERGMLSGGRGGGPDFELLQRLAAGGAAGRVLFHPLTLGPQGPQSLYAPSTIRYAPPELPPSHPGAEGLRSDHHKGPPAFFPHLQRLAGLPSFSGFSASDNPFNPFCMNGLRGAAGSEED